MKIFIAANDSYGLYLFRRDLISRLIADGHEVYASLPDGECTQRIKELGVHFIETDVDRRGLSVSKDFRLLCRYIKLLRRIRPDHVITYTIKPNVYCGMAARLLGIPCSINITGLGTAFAKPGPLKTFAKLLYRIGCSRAKNVFTENPGISEQLLEMKLFKPEQICTLNGAGVDLERFAQTPYPPDGRLSFLFIGRIMREKGIDEYISAAERLLGEGLNAEFHIAGSYEDDYREVIEQKSAEGKLVYHGFLDDIRPLIAQCHCFVLPSWHEGMANTLLECGAMGRPLITSDIHGCMEAVRDGVTGILCRPRDAQSLYEALARFAALPYADKVRMGQASHEYVSAKFDKKQVVEQTVRRLY